MFRPGDILKRSHLHDQYGGSVRHGIVRLAKHPYLFLFNSSGPLTEAYEDGWVSSRVFRYAGEGQKGDQQMTQSNLALRDHEKRGKRVFLFQMLPKRKGYCEVIGEVRYVGHSVVDHIDADSNSRKMFSFELELLDVANPRSEYPVSLTQARRKAAEATQPSFYDAFAEIATFLESLLRAVPPGGVVPPNLGVTSDATHARVAVGGAVFYVVRDVDAGLLRTFQVDMENGATVRVLPLEPTSAPPVNSAIARSLPDHRLVVGATVAQFVVDWLDWHTAYDRRRTQQLFARLLESAGPGLVDRIPGLGAAIGQPLT